MLPTGIYIPRAFWNSKQRIILNKLPLNFGEVDLLNHRLNKMMRRAEDIILLAKETKNKDEIQFLKKYHGTDNTLEEIKVEGQKIAKDHELTIVHKLDIYFQIDDYIQSKTKKVCKDMPRIYRNMKEHLLEFETYRCEPITFNNLNLTFYEEFVDFLMYEYVQRRRSEKIVGFKVNTVGKTISNSGHSFEIESGRELFHLLIWMVGRFWKKKWMQFI